MYGLTDQQARAFRAVADGGDRGVTAERVRDVLYPPDSKMRTYRPRSGTNRAPGADGGLGNLAAGRLLAALTTKRLVRRVSRAPYRYVLTELGKTRAGIEHTGTLNFDGKEPG